MPVVKAISQRQLMAKLKALEFEGPFKATKHQYMIRGKHKIFIPNPHKSKDIGIPILKKIIRQLGISQDKFIDL